MNKKGSLSLSITAIVVIVIAFVVLGLSLSLTRTIFKGAEDKLPEAFAVTQLEAEPTSANPITIQQTIEISRNDEKTMSVGFYNKDTNTATAAAFVVTECLDKAKTPVDLKPEMASISQDVPANTAVGFSLILTENGLAPGTYICTLGVCKDGDCDTTPAYQEKQFFLTVTS
ncbi:hypothetical protein COV17_03090 [Candidatus Woesearchaeota archaeon CG10_big_fil_rev_8_21_14_0_10_36_11]|nr:MAG: hypothetical protein COV17_03090 [Candidatus Woesearchaeota archaeon CG10_big_fil_rev_8_21_14_0_10_36_11]